MIEGIYREREREFQERVCVSPKISLCPPSDFFAYSPVVPRQAQVVAMVAETAAMTVAILRPATHHERLHVAMLGTMIGEVPLVPAMGIVAIEAIRRETLPVANHIRCPHGAALVLGW